VAAAIFRPERAMIVELGHFALTLALVVAFIQATLPLWGAERNDARLMGLARPAAMAQLLCILVAFGALMQAYIVSDFSVAAVAHNSNSLQPLIYRMAGLWGNHEGSLLLWVAILAIYGAAVAAFGDNLPARLQARVLAVQATIAFGFLAFMLLTSNPFARLDPAPADGAELNPILQDPGLAFHPPTLYLGYVGLSMAFSFAVAALIEGRVDAAWARWVRPWTLAAWTCLTAGIGAGSWWAYHTLGWGGWWFWDPVENASFMPWLAATALLHSAIVVEKRDALKAWTILLAILAFGLSLIGTFLVRSGVITSVHSFASDPTRGVFILGLLIFYIGGALILFAWRAPSLKPGGLFAPISREGALLINNLLLVTAAATVFLGTLYPLFLDVMGGGSVSVGEPYYNATFLPIVLPLIGLTAAGPFLSWKRADLPGVLMRLKFALAIAVMTALLCWWLNQGGPLLALLGAALAAWLFIGALSEFVGRSRLFGAGAFGRLQRLPRAAYGMTLAHAGLAIAVLGMTGSSAWKQEDIRILKPGESGAIAGYSYRLDSVGPVEGPNYHATRAQFTFSREGETIAVLRPEKRVYPVAGSSTTQAAIHASRLSDIYAVIGEPDGKGGWTVRVYHEPLVPLIWGGILVMAAGGMVSLSDRRYRIGAPLRARGSEVRAR
jgi:cytochrome c-type biogenesis protein CcmF